MKTKFKINDEIKTLDLATKKKRYGRILSINDTTVYVEMYDIFAVNEYSFKMIRKINDK